MQGQGYSEGTIVSTQEVLVGRPGLESSDVTHRPCTSQWQG
jgi:hypothetical protein